MTAVPFTIWAGCQLGLDLATRRVLNELVKAADALGRVDISQAELRLRAGVRRDQLDFARAELAGRGLMLGAHGRGRLAAKLPVLIATGRPHRAAPGTEPHQEEA